MSSITITKTFRIANVPTNVTSFTIGITRADTNEIVVATGTAMENSGTGVYTYTFAAPSAGLVYNLTFVIVHSGQTYNLTDSYTDTTAESVPMPSLTGDILQDTLNALLVERLTVSRNGAKPSYSLHGHQVFWTEYLAELDKRIMDARKELAMAEPWEIHSIAH